MREDKSAAELNADYETSKTNSRNSISAVANSMINRNKANRSGSRRIGKGATPPSSVLKNRSFDDSSNATTDNTLSNNSNQPLSNIKLSSTSTLQSLVESGVFTVRQMSNDACPSVVLITDGVSGLLDAFDLETSYNRYDGLIMLLNRENIPCSIIHVDSTCGNLHSNSPYGYISDTDHLQYICHASNGSFLSTRDIKSSGKERTKLFQAEILLKFLFIKKPYFTKLSNKSKLITGITNTEENSLSYSYSSERVIIHETSIVNSLTAIDLPFPWILYPSISRSSEHNITRSISYLSNSSWCPSTYSEDNTVTLNIPIPILKSKIRKYSIPADLIYIMDVRLKEGFQFLSCPVIHVSDQNSLQCLSGWLYHCFCLIY